MEQKFNLHEIDGVVLVTGEVDLAAAEWIIRKGPYQSLDISQATFIVDQEEWRQFLGYSHSGPVYGASGWRDVDVLKRFLENVSADKVIVPDNIARRHINAASRNEALFQVEVPDNCRLFAMKDGNVYNKKLTKLAFQAKTPDQIYKHKMEVIRSGANMALVELSSFMDCDNIFDSIVVGDIKFAFEYYLQACDLLVETFGDLANINMETHRRLETVYDAAYGKDTLPPDMFEQVKEFVDVMWNFFYDAINRTVEPA